jgi:hypothetical protein
MNKVNSIILLQNNIRLYLKKLKLLPVLKYNKTELNYNSINCFNISTKCLNDKNNKIRENIIGAIINNKIPKEYFNLSLRWNFLEKNIFLFINNLVETKIDKIQCIHKGGRKYNYDFIFIINNTLKFNVEFKFNTCEKNDITQFVSPMKPSQYMSSSYEDFYYDNYLLKLADKFKLKIPNKNIYNNEIHSISPSCMKEYQDKYYKGCSKSSKYTKNVDDINFYECAKKYDNESKINFIKNNTLDIIKLTDYLINTQKDKIYMLYKNGKFYIEKINLDDYRLVNYEKKPDKYKFIAKSKSGKEINILLRWKNGNGIAYPSFQIS